MNKTELVSSVAEKAGLTKKEAEGAVKALVESITEALENNDRVQLVGFGTFEVRERAAREGINPKTKEPLTIEAKKVPHFKAGKELKEKVNK